MSWVGWAVIVMIAGIVLLVAALYLMTEYENDKKRRQR